jgi:S-ribosylhomocysteine lyase
MGCLTGFYFITNTKHEIQPKEIEKLIRAAYRHQAKYKGDVPGATPVNCGNYLLHDLAMAKYEAKEFLAREWKFEYPKAKRVKVGDKTFFDA